MAKYISMDNLKFVLHEMLQVQNLCKLDRFKDYDKESIDILIQSSKDYADKVMYPVLKEMDENPAHYKDGKIIVHPAVGEIMKYAGQNGMIGATFDYEVGGMQLPHTISVALSHISASANNSVGGYAGLTTGAADLIVTFGEQDLIDTYVPNMMAGKWGGTMCLTEPQAGSSLSDITTSAKPNSDGSYAIKGQKIFISGGDHEYCDNFVHLVLARIDGAPPGTKGISLFVVPKKKILADGSLESNNVDTVGDFQKMGQRGYCTTHLVFGEKAEATGWLVGPENQGLKCMFQMMNGARIDVGITAAAVATAAYYASLQYAKERPQGRRILDGGQKNIDHEQVTIIDHPDVRRMLLLQKSITEGSVAVLMQAAYYHDMAEYGDEDQKERYHDLLELLTPIAKTYPSEAGQHSISTGLQILGGYGFCTDFPLEQYYRDIRIMSLYEGTTGIQSLDLLGRKVVMKGGAAMRFLSEEIKETITAASNYDDLKPYVDQLVGATKNMEATLAHLLQYAMSGRHERYIADATTFMEYMSIIVVAWQWLKMATISKTALVTGNKSLPHSFYEEKIHTMKFFYKYELVKISSLAETLRHPDALIIKEDNVLKFES